MDYEYKYEVTLQKISYLEKEKDSFTSRFKQNLHTVEQKAGLRVIKLIISLEFNFGKEIRNS